MIDAQWLQDDATRAKAERSAPPPTASEGAHASRASTSWAQAAIDRECEAVRATTKGGRNHRLNEAAFNLGQIVGGGHADRSAVANELTRAALAAGLGAAEIHKTLASGLAAGSAQPRHPPATLTMSPRPAADERLVIRLGADLHRIVDQAVQALGRDPTLYQRDAHLVHIVRPSEADEYQSAGTPQIRPVPIAQLTERLTKVARFEKFDGRTKTWRPCIPDVKVVAAVSVRGDWPEVRPLVGVLEAPTMRQDGTIVQDPGYDVATGYVLDTRVKFPTMPENPTQDDAREALKTLMEVWEDFPLPAEAQRYVPAAAVMTLLTRPAIRGACPASLFDASAAASGKTLVTDTVGVIATGRGAPRKSYPPNPEELEKVLAAYALRAAALISFDNVEGTFGGGPLDQVLTAEDKVELRVLGRSEIPSLKWRAVVMATGNNMSLKSDTTRRALLARLEPNVERPEERTGFKHPDLLKWVRAERPRLAIAALTVVRAYVVAGRPKQNVQKWGSFDDWVNLIASAIVFAGGPDVVSCRGSAEEGIDPETEALRVIMNELPRLAEDGATAKTIITSLYPHERLRGQAPPDGFEPLREAIETLVPTQMGKQPSARRLAGKLRNGRGRIIGGKRIIYRVSKGMRIWLVTG